jgi:hypothetical protein
MGNGQFYESIVFEEGEIWFDSQGCIRQFSRRYDDGTVGNYILMDVNATDENSNSVTNTILNDLSSFGIQMIGNSLFLDGGIITNLAKFLFKKYGKIAVTDVFKQSSHPRYVYVAIDNNEFVFNGVLNMANGEYVNNLNFNIRNPFNYSLKFQVSRDKYDWKQFEVDGRKLLKVYFANNQREGWFRVYTNDVGFNTFYVKSGENYVIDIDKEKKIYSLFKE